MPIRTLDRSVDPNSIVFQVYPSSLQKVRIAFLGLDQSTGLELFEFEDPKILPGTEANFKRDYFRAGFFHVAFTVPNIESICAKVVQMGGKRVGPNMPATEDKSCCYVQDPWGNIIELMDFTFQQLIAEMEI